MIYRRRITTVNAFQYTGREALDRAPKWAQLAMSRGALHLEIENGQARVAIASPSGVVYAEEGDWIVQASPNDLYAIKKDTFAELYEPV